MTKYLIIICVILLLSLIIAVKTAVYKSKKLKETEKNLEKQKEINTKKEEIYAQAREDKQKIYTGNSDDNFNNSLDILQNLSSRK